LLESVRRAVGFVVRSGQESALIGGLTVSIRSEPRSTRDADLAVAVADESVAEMVTHGFISEGYRLEVTLEQTDVDRLSGTRLIDPEGFSVDLLFASSGIEVEVVRRAEQLQIAPDLCVPVATVGDHIAFKLLAVDDRPTARIFER
jgi:predicted nucleotidyltransferase